MPANSFTYSLPDRLEEAVNNELSAWRSASKIARIWQKDASLWTGADEADWLGWLTVADEELAECDKYDGLRDEAQADGLTHTLLMGMGGSSLCPEVLALTFGTDNFQILDSTVPAQVQAIENALDLEKTLFIVASKSGSTLEPNCFKQYFFERLSEKIGEENAGKQFIAITDPGSKLERVAREDGFRQVFYGEQSVGGRFSALSPFGMTAAAAMGLDVKRLLKGAAEMAAECREADVSQNPGALLGIILGICHTAGRDKLTIYTSPEVHDVGAWLEQLIAESTGKEGKAIIPVDREPLQPSVSYGADRVFVNITLKDGTPSGVDLAALRASGHPVLEIEMHDRYDLGREFFRWEFATAVAGAIMGINPFNQPDVESAKIEAKKITEEYERTGSLPKESPFFEADGIKLFATDEHAERLRKMVDEPRLPEFLSAHFAHVEENDYFALLAYIQMNERTEELLTKIRERVLELRLAATCLGFGPRFLHSTGQAYKGGANNGVFLQITSDDAEDMKVPGQQYTFGVVKAAQAQGDLQVLQDRGRRALRVHLGEDVVAGLEKLIELTSSDGPNSPL